MRNVKKWSWIVCGLLTLAIALPAFAGNGSTTRTRTQIRERLRDGSCLTSAGSASRSAASVKKESGDLLRLRLRDGSCQTTTTP